MGADVDPFYGAPTVIIVFADSRVNTYLEDGTLVMGNLLLAAHACDLGACWIHRAKQTFETEEGKALTARNMKIIREIAERTEKIERFVEELVSARKVANKIENEHDKAIAYHDTVAPKMEEIRYQIDKLELTVADELWTLPKYRELLFIR